MQCYSEAVSFGPSGLTKQSLGLSKVRVEVGTKENWFAAVLDCHYICSPCNASCIRCVLLLCLRLRLCKEVGPPSMNSSIKLDPALPLIFLRRLRGYGPCDAEPNMNRECFVELLLL